MSRRVGQIRGKKARRRLEQSQAAATASATTPSRPWRWRRFVLRGLLLIMLLLIASHWWWGHFAQGNAEDLVAEYAARGEPIHVEDFRSRGRVPTTQNAAEGLRDALRLFGDSKESAKLLDSLNIELPLSDNAMKSIARLMAANDAAVRATQAAVHRPRVDWAIDWKTPALQVSGESLSDFQRLARLLRAAALRAHQLDDDRNAIQHVRTLLALGQVIDAQQLPGSHLIATAISSLAARTACELAPDLHVPSPCGPLLARLINEMIDDHTLLEGQKDALLAYRTIVWDSAQEVVRGRSDLLNPLTGQNNMSGVPKVSGGWLGGYGARPLVMADAAELMRHTTLTRHRLDYALDIQTFLLAAPALPPEFRTSPRLHFFANSMELDLLWLIRGTFRAATERQLAAVALAAGWYASDHAGTLPPRLDSLMPDYLKALPIDRMARSAPPVRMTTVNGMPVVYSLGDNGLDDKAIDAPAGVTASNLVRLWDRKDVTIPLRRPKPAKLGPL